jgi:hypothetical protein
MLDQLYQEASDKLDQMQELSQRVLKMPQEELKDQAELARDFRELTDYFNSYEDGRFGIMLGSVPGSKQKMNDFSAAHGLLCGNGHRDILHPKADEPAELVVEAPLPDRPDVPLPPGGLDHLPGYLQDVYSWIVGELSDLFETVPADLLDELPKAGSKYLFADFNQTKLVVDNIACLVETHKLWKTFKEDHRRSWSEEKTCVNRLSFVRGVCSRYVEIVTPPEVGTQHLIKLLV